MCGKWDITIVPPVDGPPQWFLSPKWASRVAECHLMGERKVKDN